MISIVILCLVMQAKPHGIAANGSKESPENFDALGYVDVDRFADAVIRDDSVDQILVRLGRDALSDANETVGGVTTVTPPTVSSPTVSPPTVSSPTVSPLNDTSTHGNSTKKPPLDENDHEWIPLVIAGTILFGIMIIAGLIWLCIRRERQRRIEKAATKTSSKTVIECSTRAREDASSSGLKLLENRSYEDISGDATDSRDFGMPSVRAGLWAQKTIVDSSNTPPGGESPAPSVASKKVSATTKAETLVTITAESPTASKTHKHAGESPSPTITKHTEHIAPSPATTKRLAESLAPADQTKHDVISIATGKHIKHAVESTATTKHLGTAESIARKHAKHESPTPMKSTAPSEAVTRTKHEAAVSKHPPDHSDESHAKTTRPALDHHHAHHPTLPSVSASEVGEHS